MELLPIFLDLNRRHCLIVGGGELAFRKATLLAKASANLSFVAEDFSENIRKLASDNNFTLTESKFKKEHVVNSKLVIAATSCNETNALVAKTAESLNIPVNVVDQPALCSFIMPAIVDRSPIVIAISSTGKSPVLTRKIKELNETMLSGNIGKLATILGSYREKVKKRFPNFKDRLRFWEKVIDSEVSELVYAGKNELAEAVINKRLTQIDVETGIGEVYLVGAGPGDPDLLTLRALRLLYKADVVLYDRLVSREVLGKIRPDAERIPVGKKRSKHSVEQETINQMLIRLARSGKRVLRLKGGDPFIFGRGGEEIETLAQSEIPFQIVPGITAASGCGSYAGIPLTHRDHAQSVRFLTGHLKEGTLKLDWKGLVNAHETLVFYMGLLGLRTICQELVNHGMAPDTLIAAIEQGTRQNQRVIAANLKSMPDLSDSAKLESPTIIIIGSVVSLRSKLEWFN
jgi:uroporphyrin-III C-methyltransferase/precorrin-2 dehydrogenase/sirohydrochlorin ferrochelatase